MRQSVKSSLNLHISTAANKKYPSFTFSQSSAQIYPETLKEVKHRIKKSRRGIVGESWVEHNANIISRELLVRQYIYGKKIFYEKVRG
ncbi:TPA: hypothetical protein EYP70_02300 [Candidatus Bathyarchaeota archaeon]|nr:hypothetical protein [Candidatus Bathyarchaeota archaeon]